MSYESVNRILKSDYKLQFFFYYKYILISATKFKTFYLLTFLLFTFFINSLYFVPSGPEEKEV